MPSSHWYRGHGLGNDYLVFEGEGGVEQDRGVEEGPGVVESRRVEGSRGVEDNRGVEDPRGTEAQWALSPDAVRRICERHTGVGADGIVVLLDREPPDGIFPLRMFNPDGSEFERSGNGLRVLASHLFREGLVRGDPFQVRSGGAVIRMVVHAHTAEASFDVSVEMGKGSAGGHPQGIRADSLDGDGRVPRPGLPPIPFTAVWVGNPHAVVFLEELDVGAGPEASTGRDAAPRPGAGSGPDAAPGPGAGPGPDAAPDPAALLRDIGPLLATHPAFPAGTNVQLAEVTGPGRVRIGIWERGVGRTSASGTSSCAAAFAAVHTGRLDPGAIVVEMEGGELSVEVSGTGDVTLRGPVEEIATGRLAPGFLVSLPSR